MRTSVMDSQGPSGSSSWASRPDDLLPAQLLAATGSALQMLAGVAASLLACIGLAHLDAGLTGSAAALVLGMGLTAEGIGVAGAHAGDVGYASHPSLKPTWVGSAITLQVVSGISCVAIAVVALTGFMVWPALAACAALFGVTLAWSFWSRLRLNHESFTEGLAHSQRGERSARRLIAAASLTALTGVLVTALAALALLQVGPVSTLVLLALLLAALANALDGAAFMARIASAIGELR